MLRARLKIFKIIDYFLHCLHVVMDLVMKTVLGTIISAGKTVMASEYKDRATVEMGKKVNFTPVFKEQ